MKIMMSLALAVLGVLTADSAPISVFKSQDITEANQYFEFTFNTLPADSALGGTLCFNVSGDFSDNIASEYVEFTLDSVAGSLRMDESGVLANTIAGLSLTGFSSQNVLDRYDETFQADFFASSSLLDELLADGEVAITAQNGSGVTPGYALGQFGTDPDYVEVGLGYATIPEPSTLGLMGACTFGLLGIRGRRKLYLAILRATFGRPRKHLSKKGSAQRGNKDYASPVETRLTSRPRHHHGVRIDF